jgi:hypothetical protein
MYYGIQFRLPPRYADGPTARYITHMFDMRCRENGIWQRAASIPISAGVSGIPG